ncbi:MAG TPA: YggS family pyridoxal phosphate-dependent enzyme [Sphaerochaeta sp.]|nr:YggS family pyridoxal phosphate-dependent enzyme [Spirochaetota bacterium]HOE89044.1 YggS family pyridoxal phosphate-dependent enzyme [Sphaerochaeta sp.]HPK64429.1 YggS family pyridoxal phosphate-dependent enzyme [Sphaerochaeta sp.]
MTALAEIRQEIEEAAGKSGRSLTDISLMAVSKTQPYERILDLYDEGQLLFGENRVQEAADKLPGDRPQGMNVHLIGHLQSNKAKRALTLFDRIDSIDSLRLARILEKQLDRPYPILLQLKTSDEESKYGFADEDELLFALEAISSFRYLTVKGIMSIGPLTSDETVTRKAFEQTRKLYHRAQELFPDLNLDTLSMGMSGDFVLAIAEGSTMVRIGTRLFGART